MLNDCQRCAVYGSVQYDCIKCSKELAIVQSMALNQNMESMQQTNEALLKKLAEKDVVNKELVGALYKIRSWALACNYPKLADEVDETLTKAGAL